jgi:hypothetical protein
LSFSLCEARADLIRRGGELTSRRSAPELALWLQIWKEVSLSCTLQRVYNTTTLTIAHIRDKSQIGTSKVSGSFLLGFRQPSFPHGIQQYCIQIWKGAPHLYGRFSLGRCYWRTFRRESRVMVKTSRGIFIDGWMFLCQNKHLSVETFVDNREPLKMILSWLFGTSCSPPFIPGSFL